MEKTTSHSDREDLINTAVKFLKDPNVAKTPDNRKKNFLVTKGLTESEIDQALHIAHSSHMATSNLAPSSHAANSNNNALAAPEIPERDQTLLQYNTIDPSLLRIAEKPLWWKIRDTIMFGYVVAGGTYALYRLYKDLVKPYFSGRDPTDKELNESTDAITLQATLQDTLIAVKDMLVTVQTTLTNQQAQIDDILSSINTQKSRENLAAFRETNAYDELKAEITSVKGLLLSRHQFPRNPTITPTLPAWQLLDPETSANKHKTATKDAKEGVKTDTSQDAEDIRKESQISNNDKMGVSQNEKNEKFGNYQNDNLRFENIEKIVNDSILVDTSQPAINEKLEYFKKDGNFQLTNEATDAQDNDDLSASLATSTLLDRGDFTSIQ